MGEHAKVLAQLGGSSCVGEHRIVGLCLRWQAKQQPLAGDIHNRKVTARDAGFGRANQSDQDDPGLIIGVQLIQSCFYYQITRTLKFPCLSPTAKTTTGRPGDFLKHLKT